MTQSNKIQLEQLLHLLKEILLNPPQSTKDLMRILKKFPKDSKGYYSKSELIAAYKHFIHTGQIKEGKINILKLLQMKPTRSLSGITAITLLTKPYPCPGKCIFCPNDIRMPKSYISSEPGAQRAATNGFDPYLQTYNRLNALVNIGHTVDKAEVIVLGGTWSTYKDEYKRWFIKRIFEALNDFGDNLDQRPQITHSINVSQISDSLSGIEVGESKMKVSYNQRVSQIYKDQEQAKNNLESATWEQVEFEQKRNEQAKVRCVGLVLETRPDWISQEEVLMLRRFGCTKAQIGLQSLSDKVLSLNHRGHNVAASRKAMRLLRQAGLKIHAHWMPNLYGSNPQDDMQDYLKLFTDPDFMPDELKIYPCSLIEKTPLVNLYKQGKWQPYTHDELLYILSQAIKHTPAYCRLTRIVRDIPSTDIVTGNKLTNFRQIAETSLESQNIRINEIRHREIKNHQVSKDGLIQNIHCYQTSTSIEYFLEYITKDNPKLSNPKNKIAGFLRLSLPIKTFVSELSNSAIIREIHVYGSVVAIGKSKSSATQHLGLGKKLIKQAVQIAKEANYKQLSVISAVGTRDYYRKQGFTDGTLYQHFKL